MLSHVHLPSAVLHSAFLHTKPKQCGRGNTSQWTVTLVLRRRHVVVSLYPPQTQGSNGASDVTLLSGASIATFTVSTSTVRRRQRPRSPPIYAGAGRHGRVNVQA